MNFAPLCEITACCHAAPPPMPVVEPRQPTVSADIILASRKCDSSISCHYLSPRCGWSLMIQGRRRCDRHACLSFTTGELTLLQLTNSLLEVGDSRLCYLVSSSSIPLCHDWDGRDDCDCTDKFKHVLFRPQGQQFWISTGYNWWSW